MKCTAHNSRLFLVPTNMQILFIRINKHIFNSCSWFVSHFFVFVCCVAVWTPPTWNASNSRLASAKCTEKTTRWLRRCSTIWRRSPFYMLVSIIVQRKTMFCGSREHVIIMGAASGLSGHLYPFLWKCIWSLLSQSCFVVTLLNLVYDTTHILLFLSDKN